MSGLLTSVGDAIIDASELATIGGQVISAWVDPAHAPAADVDTELDRLIISNTQIAGVLGRLDLIGSNTSASLSTTIEGASELSLTMSDPDRAIIGSGIFDRQVDGRLDAGIELNLAVDPLLGRYSYRLASVGYSHSAGETTLRLEDRIVALLRDHTRRRRWKRSTTTRAEVELAMAQEVKAARIRFVCPDLHETKPLEKATKTQRAAAKDPGFRSGSTLQWHNPTNGQVETAGPQQTRDLQEVLLEGERQKGGQRVLTMGTMTVLQESRAKRSATNGVHVGMFQQDPRYWPATRDPTTDSRAFFQRIIPIARAHPTWSYAQTIEAVQGSGQGPLYAPWQNDAEAIVAAFNGGLSAGTATAGDEDVTFYRGEPGGEVEDSWTAGQRLANEVGRRLFPVAETLYYIDETDLYRAQPQAIISVEDATVEDLSFTWDVRQSVNELEVTVRIGQWQLPVGSCVDVVGLGAANGRWILAQRSRAFGSTLATLTLRQAIAETPEPRASTTSTSSATVAAGKLTSSGGAKGIVDQLVKIAQAAGGTGVYVGSSFRPGSTTSSGNVSDHASNDAGRAARDIGVQGIDLITGPPSPKLDKACAAIVSALGGSYQEGTTIVQNFQFAGYQVQVIWRTPLYGGHMGHVHCGAHKL